MTWMWCAVCKEKGYLIELRYDYLSDDSVKFKCEVCGTEYNHKGKPIERG